MLYVDESDMTSFDSSTQCVFSRYLIPAIFGHVILIRVVLSVTTFRVETACRSTPTGPLSVMTLGVNSNRRAFGAGL